jgi:hypothetical protein
MDIQGMATVLPVDDVAAAAGVWATLLGAAPTFVDGVRWALFDVWRSPGPTGSRTSLD